MTSLILKLQRLAADSSTSVAELLRKSRVVATKLDLEEFNQFLQHELHGYPPEIDVPRYRIVRGDIRAFNPYNGHHVPVRFGAAITDKLSTTHNRQSVGQLEDVLRAGGDRIECPFSESTMESIREMLGPADREWLHPTRHLASTQVSGILDAVRNTVLDWSLQLEKEGILGDGHTFSDEERERASSSTHISIGTFQGILGPVRGSTVTQNLDLSVQEGDLDSLRRYLASLEVDSIDVDQLEAALHSDSKPESPHEFGTNVSGWIGSMVGKAASGAWNVGINVAGRVLSSAITSYYGIK